MLEKQWQKLIKKDKLRQKLKVDKKAYKAYLYKDKFRKARKWLNEKQSLTDQQKTAFKLKEHNQLKTISKAAAAKQNCQGIQSKNIAPYQN